MTKRIVSVKGLAEMTGTHRTRLHDYLREGRLKPEYQDDSGHGYWSITEAKKIAEKIAKARSELRRGPGQKLDIGGKPKCSGAEDPPV